jgi:uncharacterized membrane protein YbhN (UPF0104 family)
VPASAFATVAAYFLVALSLGTLRWGLLLSAFGAPRRPPWTRLARLYFVGLFYNSFLPGGMGGDVVRGIATREAFGDGNATAGLSVVLVERVLGLAALLGLMAVVTLARPIEGVPEPRVLGAAGLLAVLIALFGLLFARRLAPHLPGPLGRLAAAVPVPARYAPIAAALLIAAAGHVVVATGGHALVHALAPQVSLNESLVLIPTAMASAFVPITISGAGVREAAFVTLYGLIGVSRSAALAASLGMWACQLLMAALGGVIALFTPLSAARPQGTEVAQPEG